MEQLPMFGPPVDPVESLLADIVEEAMIETIANKDASLFWIKLKEHLFETALVNFEESYSNFIGDLGENANCFDYFVRFIHRTVAKPYASEALLKMKECHNSFNNSTSVKNLIIISIDTGDDAKSVCHMLALYSSIITFRLVRLSSDNKGGS